VPSKLHATVETGDWIALIMDAIPGLWPVRRGAPQRCTPPATRTPSWPGTAAPQALPPALERLPDLDGWGKLAAPRRPDRVGTPVRRPVGRRNNKLAGLDQRRTAVPSRNPTACAAAPGPWNRATAAPPASTATGPPHARPALGPPRRPAPEDARSEVPPRDRTP
jgi:hypothetical protein